MVTSQDYDLWLRFSENYKIGCLPKVKVFLRNHSSRISNKNKGVTQKVDAYLALVSYRLRKKNKFPDPLNSECKNGIDLIFKKFVFEKLSFYDHI